MEPQRPAGRVFVGRERELSELTAALDDALTGRGDLFLIGGDAGIGKTRLAEELTWHAGERGAHVVWASCWEGPGPPPYWPWLEVLRACLDGDLPDSASQDPLGALFPELAGTAASDATARFRLFDAVTTFVVAAARMQPLVLVFDDLHWADVPSVRLLDFFARSVREVPVLLLGMYREAEALRTPELAEPLLALARRGTTLPLRGLSQADVATVVHEGFGVDPPEEIVSALWSLTEGNPFFVHEIVRLFLAEMGDEEGTPGFTVPQGVREVIRRRLEPLPDETRHLLRLASVVGREFDVAVLEAASGLGALEVQRALWQTAGYGVLDEGVPPAGAHRFCHALVREALYEELPPDERAEAHLQVGEALERTQDEGALAELAHHFAGAGDRAPPRKALSYLIRAGERASDRLAYEEAAGHYSRALELVDAEAQERTDLLLALGEARRRAGGVEAAMVAFRQAAETARSDDSSERFVRAVTGFEDSRLRAGDFLAVPESFLLLQQALERLGDEDRALRVEVLSCRPQLLQFAGAPLEETISAAQEAVDEAEALGDQRLVARALDGLCWAYQDHAHAEDGLAAAERLVRTARGAGESESALYGDIYRATFLLMLGRADQLDAQILVVEEAAGTIGQPWFAWWPSALRAARALMRGALEDAAREAETVTQAARDRGDQGAAIAAGYLLTACAWELGDGEAVRRALEGVIDLIPLPAFRATARAFIGVSAGREVEARQAFDEVTSDLDRLPGGGMRLPLVAVLSSVCGSLGDDGRAEELSVIMRTVGRRVVVIPMVAGFLSTPHWLGILAATMAEDVAAERHFEEALQLHADMGAWGWLARTRLEYGRFLRQRGGEEASARAFLLLRGARMLAVSLGLVSVAEQAAAELDVPDLEPSPASDRVEEATFRREGDMWRLTFAGRTVQVKDTKGMSYLACLLRQPGEEIHVLRLLALVEGSGGAPATASAAEAREAGLSTAVEASGSGLDAEAVEAFRRRLGELKDEVDEAETLGDPVRAMRVREEADWIGREMSRGLGLGGRERGQGAPVERARVNVRRTIRASLDRVTKVHPELGSHLEALVRTGTFCTYLTDPRHAIHWEV